MVQEPVDDGHPARRYRSLEPIAAASTALGDVPFQHMNVPRNDGTFHSLLCDAEAAVQRPVEHVKVAREQRVPHRPAPVNRPSLCIQPRNEIQGARSYSHLKKRQGGQRLEVG